MTEFIVIMPRAEGNSEHGYSTCYYSDMRRFSTLKKVIRHGAVDLDQADDFLIGMIVGNKLVALQWMEEVRDDYDERIEAAEQLGLKS
jgi:hypothetical protein